MAKKISLLIALLFLFSCAQIVRNPVKFDEQVFMNNYDKMFSAAISKGTEMSYRIDHQDKEHGLLKMSRKVIFSTYSITVKFDVDRFTVTGNIDTDLFNPFIGKDVRIIENAIKEVVR
jgi:hypothetical protein